MVQEYWKQAWKIRKMVAASRRNLFWLSFQDVFWKFLCAVYPSRVQVKFKGKQTNKQKVVIVFLGLKDWCFKSRREMSRFQEVPFAISLVLIFPWKSTQVKIHSKLAIACLVFSAKNPVKSDKLALIEGKVLNEMILDIYIPVVPIDNWLGATHNQRQKNSQSRFSPIIPPYFKDEIVAWMHIYYMLYTHRFARIPARK